MDASSLENVEQFPKLDVGEHLGRNRAVELEQRGHRHRFLGVKQNHVFNKDDALDVVVLFLFVVTRDAGEATLETQATLLFEVGLFFFPLCFQPKTPPPPSDVKPCKVSTGIWIGTALGGRGIQL